MLLSVAIFWGCSDCVEDLDVCGWCCKGLTKMLMGFGFRGEKKILMNGSETDDRRGGGKCLY